jgi:ribosomal protein uS11
MAFGPRQVIHTHGKGSADAKRGVVHISNTHNNIVIALTDPEGRVKALRSAGMVGFRNARKSQPVAAERTADALAQAALQQGFSSVVVRMKGVGPHKQLAVTSLAAAGLRITELQDVTPIAYNGCRLPKRRRV